MYHFQFNSYSFDGPSWLLTVAAAIAVYLMQAVAYWCIFKKAGEKKGRAFVPGLNAYTQFKLSWSKAAFWIFLALCIVEGVFSWANPVSTLVPNSYYVFLASSAAVMVMHIISCFKLSKSFGHGFGWALGLMLFPQIFMLTIGLGGSEYVGRGGKKDGE